MSILSWSKNGRPDDGPAEEANSLASGRGDTAWREGIAWLYVCYGADSSSYSAATSLAVIASSKNFSSSMRPVYGGSQ